MKPKALRAGLLGLALSGLLTACAGRTVVPVNPVASAPVAPAAGASETALSAGPSLTSLGVSDESARRALIAFRVSCPVLLRRTDQSQMTVGADWQGACAAALAAKDDAASTFFIEQFDVTRVDKGEAFATGYYEPQIAGSRARSIDYPVPLYRKPAELIEVDLGKFSEKLADRKVRGRVSGSDLVPYFERGEIEDGAIAGRGLELAWAADPIEAFFLEVQGSGRLKLPDGSVMRIGYAGQNGRDYTAIGAVMRKRGLLEAGAASMQGIMAWLRANSVEGRAIMRENKSFVFFRELTGPGPIGALGTPVTERATVAADPKFVPLGAPVVLAMDRAETNGLWIAQDTGGAIKGANRFDTFWGAGDEARTVAGSMSTRGTAYILLPKGVLNRRTSEARPAP